MLRRNEAKAVRSKRREAKRKNGEGREAEQGGSGERGEAEEEEEEGRNGTVVEETSGNNTRAVVTPASYYRSSIDPLPIRSQPTLRNHYTRRVVFPTVKNPPCRGGTVRCFFLDGKCRRHKCLFRFNDTLSHTSAGHAYTRAPFAFLEVLPSFRWPCH